MRSGAVTGGDSFACSCGRLGSCCVAHVRRLSVGVFCENICSTKDGCGHATQSTASTAARTHSTTRTRVDLLMSSRSRAAGVNTPAADSSRRRSRGPARHGLGASGSNLRSARRSLADPAVAKPRASRWAGWLEGSRVVNRFLPCRLACSVAAPRPVSPPPCAHAVTRTASATPLPCASTITKTSCDSSRHASASTCLRAQLPMRTTIPSDDGFVPIEQLAVPFHSPDYAAAGAARTRLQSGFEFEGVPVLKPNTFSASEVCCAPLSWASRSPQEVAFCVVQYCQY